MGDREEPMRAGEDGTSGRSWGLEERESGSDSESEGWTGRKESQKWN